MGLSPAGDHPQLLKWARDRVDSGPVKIAARSSRRDCRRSERGVAAVEMAIVFPVFVMFLFGILDFGINWQHRLQSTHAAREVSRAASVARMGEVTTCPVVGITSPHPLLHQAICLAQKKSGVDAADVRVKVLYMGPNGRQSTNLANTRNSVVVCIMVRARSATLLMTPFFSGRFYTDRSVTKTAKPSGGVPVPEGQETAFPGANWNFCRPDDPVGTES